MTDRGGSGSSGPIGSGGGSRKRRKKRVATAQNQFFLHHVREMRDTATAKNWQSKHTYAKMVRALERYPLRLEGPRACLILEGFGQKTCELLQKKLADYAKELGVSEEEEALRIGNERFATSKSLKLKVRKAAAAPRQRAPSAGGESASASEADDSAGVTTGSAASTSVSLAQHLSQSSHQPHPSQHHHQPHHPQQQRPHHPKPRTGGHAILLTLLNRGGPDCRLGKADLMSMAQPLCDSSFTCPPAGSHYSAWSAMSGLVKRGLVDRTPAAGRTPGAYALTEAGRAIATTAASDQRELPPPQPPPDPQRQSVHVISDSEESDAAEAVAPMPAQPPPPTEPPLQFAYCRSAGYATVDRKSEARRRFDPEFGCDCVLVVCSYEQLVRSNLLYSLDLCAIGRFDDGQVAAFVRASDLPELSTKAAAEAVGAAKAEAEAVKHRKRAQLLPSSSSEPALAGCSLQALPLVTSKPLSWQRHASAQAAADSLPQSEAPQQPKLLYSIQAGQYDVIFCIDNREHYGMGSVKQMLLPGLLRNHVRCDVRPLQVSDFLWVAKCRETGREAVLNLLVERKRLDDLATSIKDGRFREQKFRLRRSGISQLLLLVEGFGGRGGGGGHVRMPEETLTQAVCNSQLIDGCTVKYTDSAQHTVSYLTLLTARLTDMYRGRRLLVHDSMPGGGGGGPGSRPTLSGVLPAGCGGDGADAHVVDFAEFNRAAVKSKKLVVKEMLAKHLLQIGGVTMDKAFAIVQQYPTVQALLDAYAACDSETQRRHLLSGLCYDSLFDKRIGDQISGSVRLNFTCDC